ncbi:MAG: 2'-5' RNA ligase family protein [Burkholderiaceae bacterium]
MSRALGSVALNSGARVKNFAHDCVAQFRRISGIQRASNFRHLEIAFVLPLNDAAHNYMTKLQVDILKKHGVNQGLAAPPHITLKLGFKATELGSYENYLDELAKTTAPVEIGLNNIGKFEEGILFLDVEQNHKLDHLRRRIVRELSSRFGVQPRPLEGDRYHFHATLAYGLGDRRFKDEYELLSSLAPKFHFKAKSIELLLHNGVHWVTYRRAALTGLSDSSDIVT